MEIIINAEVSFSRLCQYIESTYVIESSTFGSLSNHDDDGNKNLSNLHIWQWKTVSLHALHVHISSFDILKTFSFFLRREHDQFCSWADDVSIWWEMLIFVFLCPKRWFQFNHRIVRTHFSSIMTLSNWKMIAKPRSYIFRWRSRFRRRRVRLSSPYWEGGKGLKLENNRRIFVYTFCLINICLSVSDDANKIKTLNIERA